MTDNVYLIHEGDFIKHIDEKVLLYSFVKQLTFQIAKLPPTAGNQRLIKMAKYYETASENLFNFWGIPKSYLVCDNKEALAELMENELITPEDAGYYACDDTCCCQCGCCCDNCDLYDEDEDYDDEDDDYDEDCDEDEPDEDECFTDLMSELSTIVQSIFGDNVSLHIVVE